MLRHPAVGGINDQRRPVVRQAAELDPVRVEAPIELPLDDLVPDCQEGRGFVGRENGLFFEPGRAFQRRHRDICPVPVQVGVSPPSPGRRLGRLCERYFRDQQQQQQCSRCLHVFLSVLFLSSPVAVLSRTESPVPGSRLRESAAGPMRRTARPASSSLRTGPAPPDLRVRRARR